MSVPFERAVGEDLNLGHGSVTVTNPAGGTMSGNKIGLHTMYGGDHYVAAHDFSGADAGARVAAAMAVLPTTGGIVDCRGLQGAQIVSADMFSGITVPVTLIFGVGTWTVKAAQVPPAYCRIFGSGFRVSIFKKGFNGNMFSVTDVGFEMHGIGLDGEGGTYSGTNITLSTTSSTDFIFADSSSEDSASFGINFSTNNAGARARLVNALVTTTSGTAAAFGFPATDEFSVTGNSSYREFIGVDVVGQLWGDLGGASVTTIIGGHTGNITFQAITNGVMIDGARLGFTSGVTVQGSSITIQNCLIAAAITVAAAATGVTIQGNVLGAAITDSSGKAFLMNVGQGLATINDAADAKYQLYRAGVLEGNWEAFGGNMFLDGVGTLSMRQNVGGTAGTTRATFSYATGNLAVTGTIGGFKIQSDANGRWSTYDNVATVSKGLAYEVGTIDATGQTATVTGTTIITSAAAVTQYRVSYYVFTDTVGNAVNLTIDFGWTDPVSVAKTQGVSSNVDISTLGSRAQGVFTIVSKASQAITYTTAVSGAVGTGKWSIYVKIEAM